MDQNKSNKKIPPVLWEMFILFAVAFGLFGAFILFLKVSFEKPAACRPQIPFVLGGCNADFKISNPKITPDVPCIELDVNNCSHPSISLINSCDKDINIDGKVIPREFETCQTPVQYYVLDEEKNSTTTVFVIAEGQDSSYTLTGDKNVTFAAQFDYCLKISRSQGQRKFTINCERTMDINGVKITPLPKVCKKIPGPVTDNLASYEMAPKEDTDYNLNGTVGETNFTISYTVTKSCITAQNK